MKPEDTVKTKEEKIIDFVKKKSPRFGPEFMKLFDQIDLTLFFYLMDEWADQEKRIGAIAFAEWLDKNFVGIYNGRELLHWKVPTQMSEDEPAYTTDQLYSLFKKEQSGK